MRCISICLLLAGSMLAQDAQQSNSISSLRVHGEATVNADPDEVQFDIGVVTHAATAKAATDDNAMRSNALVQELKTLNLPADKIRNTNFSLNANYRYPSDGVPVISGYTASNSVRVLLEDINKLQTAIEIAIRSGATSINRLAFTLRDENTVRSRALFNASHQAQAEAQALASSVNMKLGKLLSIEEGQPVIVAPPREFSFDKLQSTAVTPISPASIEAHADVNLTYQVTP